MRLCVGKGGGGRKSKYLHKKGGGQPYSGAGGYREIVTIYLVPLDVHDQNNTSYVVLLLTLSRP